MIGDNCFFKNDCSIAPNTLVMIGVECGSTSARILREVYLWRERKDI